MPILKGQACCIDIWLKPPLAWHNYAKTHLINVDFPETAGRVDPCKSGQPGLGAEGYLPPRRLHQIAQVGWACRI